MSKGEAFLLNEFQGLENSTCFSNARKRPRTVFVRDFSVHDGAYDGFFTTS